MVNVHRLLREIQFILEEQYKMILVLKKYLNDRDTIYPNKQKTIKKTQHLARDTLYYYDQCYLKADFYVSEFECYRLSDILLDVIHDIKKSKVIQKSRKHNNVLENILINSEYIDKHIDDCYNVRCFDD